MEEKKNFDLKSWCMNHKKELLIGGGITIFLLHEFINNICYARGLRKFHIDGFVKFFDPTTGNEIEIEQLVKLVKKFYNL